MDTKSSLIEIDKLELALKNVSAENKKTANTSSHALSTEIQLHCKLSDLYFSVKKQALSLSHVHAAISLISKSTTVRSLGGVEVDGAYLPLVVLETALKCWKQLRHVPKASNVRINLGPERKKLLTDMLHVTDNYVSKQNITDPAIQSHLNSILVIAAFVKESLGRFQESLSILSDLIASQTVDGVDLPYVILKAALLLKHVGKTRYKQCIEYLEYLLEDPPTSEGLTKTHVLAVLLLVYEQGGEKYRVLLSKHYKELEESYHHDLDSESRNGNERVSISVGENSSEVWETLTLQAVERCQYAMAVEFANQAVLKAPNKPKLLHTLAELHYLLGETDKAVSAGERALTLQPQFAEVRNLLLLAAPDTWTDKMRTAPSSEGLKEPEAQAKRSTASKVIKVESPRDPSTIARSVRSDEKDDSVIGKVAGKAVKALSSENAPTKASESSISQNKKGKDRKGKTSSLFSLSFLPSKKKPDNVKDATQTDATIVVTPTVPIIENTERKNRVEKPRKPDGLNDPEVRKLILLALKGNNNVHYYDDNLCKLADVSKQSNMKFYRRLREGECSADRRIILRR